MIHILFGQPLGFHEQGKRQRQEDAISPSLNNISPRSPFFMVCDGVGGAAGGADASQSVCHSFERLFKGYTGDLDSIELEKMLIDTMTQAYVELDNLANKKNIAKMATTFTFIAKCKDGIITAYLGDSRIYHFRPDKGILYANKPHTLVNDLVEWGEITSTIALKHPARHVLTKAMQANDITQPPTIMLLNDICEGDYLFLCSDGVTEQIEDNLLTDIICSAHSNEDKIAKILSFCGKQATDNNTCLLIPIECASIYL